MQTLAALQDLEGLSGRRRVADLASLPASWPSGMVPELWFVRLVSAVRGALPPDRADAVLRRSGARTAVYVRRNRVPLLLRGLLRLLPSRIGIPILLAAFRRHAWTFAGAGLFAVEGGYPGTIVLEGCPTCRTEAGAVATRNACAYYEAAFEGLLRIASRRVRVREVACQAMHAPSCRFHISFEGSTEGDTCASS